MKIFHITCPPHWETVLREGFRHIVSRSKVTCTLCPLHISWTLGPILYYFTHMSKWDDMQTEAFRHPASRSLPSGGSRGDSSSSLEPLSAPPPPFSNILWKWNNLVSILKIVYTYVHFEEWYDIQSNVSVPQLQGCIQRERRSKVTHTYLCMFDSTFLTSTVRGI